MLWMPVITALAKLEFIAVISARLPRRGVGCRRRELPSRRAGEVASAAAAGGGVYRTKVHFVRSQV